MQNQGENVNDNTTMFFMIEKSKNNNFRFFTMNCKSIVILFCFNPVVHGLF